MIFVGCFKKFSKRIKTHSGMTLVEVMFVAVIGAVLFGMVSVLYVGVNHSVFVSAALTEINAGGRNVMDRVARDIRWGTQLVASRVIDTTTYITGNDEIIIEIPSIDASGDIISGTYDYIAYALDPQDQAILKKIVDPDTASSRTAVDQVVANNITSIAFSSNGTALGSLGDVTSVEAVEIGLVLNKEAVEGKEVGETLNSTVRLRNL